MLTDGCPKPQAHRTLRLRADSAWRLARLMGPWGWRMAMGLQSATVLFHLRDNTVSISSIFERTSSRSAEGSQKHRENRKESLREEKIFHSRAKFSENSNLGKLGGKSTGKLGNIKREKVWEN